MNIVNIAGYKFVGIEDPASLKPILQERCNALELKGTIILATEGINLVLAGEKRNIDRIIEYLKNENSMGSLFTDIDVKESRSKDKPFGKMVVRVAREIITMRDPIIRPENNRAPAVKASTLKKWLDKGFDDNGNEVVLLDTRNTYETEIGTFEGSIKLDIDSFGEFPDAIESKTKQTKGKLKEKTIVSFCTGGIRCEKAALYMKNLDFQNIFQLEGGILRYLEEAGADHWTGECFVFDERIALDSDLNETKKSYTKEDIGS